MTVQVIQCESQEEAIQKAEAFKNMLDSQQIIVIDNYLCTGNPGEWIECEQRWDGTNNKYITSITTQEEEKVKTQEWIEDFEEKTKVK